MASVSRSHPAVTAESIQIHKQQLRKAEAELPHWIKSYSGGDEEDPEKTRVTTTQERVALANNKHSPRISGRTEAPVQLNDQYFKTTLYAVDDLATDVFLVADFLTDRDVPVEHGRHCLHIGKSDRPTIYWKKRTYLPED